MEWRTDIMSRKEGLFGFKSVTIGILVCLLIAAGIPLLLSLGNVSGDVRNGILVVKTDVDIETATYTIKGIDVDTASGDLTFTNTTVKLQMDMGDDGTLGTADDHTYGINVKGGGKLTFDNCVLTMDTTQTNPYLYLIINVTDSTLIMKDTTVIGAGIITTDNAVDVDILNCDFVKLNPPATVVDTDAYDDAMNFDFMDSADVLIADSSFDQAPVYTSIGRHYVVNNSEAWIINTYFDVDFKDPSGTAATNKLDTFNGARTHLYACEFNESKNNAKHDGPAVMVNSTLAYSIAFVYRMADIYVKDLSGVPLPGETLTISYQNNATPIIPPSAKILSYTGWPTWDTTNEYGYTTAPLMSDMIRDDTMPNSDFIGRYEVSTNYGISVDLTLSCYPGDGTQNMTMANFPVVDLDLPDVLVDPTSPSINWFNAPQTITVTTQKTLTGTYSVVGGKVYSSYYSLNKHLVVKSGGHLTIKDTYFHLLQDADTHLYIMVEDNSILEFQNVTVESKNAEPVNIYVWGSGSNDPTIIADDSFLNINTLVVNTSGTVEMFNTNCQGSIFAENASITLDAEDTYFNNTFMRLDDADVTLLGSEVVTQQLSVGDCVFSAINTSFNQHLMFSGNDPELIGVTFTKDVAEPEISVVGVITAPVQQWVRINVVDKFLNPLPNARVGVYNYDTSLNLVEVTSGFTTSPEGAVIFPLLEKNVEATKTIYEGNYYINATYQATLGETDYIIGETRDVNITIDGAPNLHPTNMKVTGSYIQGTIMNVSCQVWNLGTFSASNILVEYYNGMYPFGSDIIPFLAPNSSVNVSEPWGNVPYGTQNVTIAVDPYDAIGEDNEDDNNITGQYKIGFGPDYSVHINSDVYTPVQGTPVNFTATVSNLGQIDVQQLNIIVRFWLGHPDQLQMLYSTSIQAVGSTPKPVVYEHVFDTPGIYDIYVTIEPVNDANDGNNINSTSVNVLTPPDLMFVVDPITFDRPDPVGQGQNVKIYITFMNGGNSDAKNFYLEIEDLRPVSGKLTLVSVKIPIVKAGTEYKYNYTTWRPDEIGDHAIWVRLDPYPGTVREINESNNNASINFGVGTKPDLVFGEDVIFNPSPVTEGEYVDITVTCKNIGGTPASGFSVKFYIDTISNLINFTTMNLSHESEQEITISYRAVQVGSNKLMAAVDQEDLIAEQLDDNNLISKDFMVITKPDLTLSANDIMFYDDLPIENSVKTNLSITIYNLGETPAGEFKVEVYDGNPNQGGESIEKLFFLVPGIGAEDSLEGNSYSFNVTWDTTVTGGTHSIYVWIDKENQVKESAEFNNIVYRDIHVKTIPDLTLEPSDIKLYVETDEGVLYPVDTAGNLKDLRVAAVIKNIGNTDSDWRDETFNITFLQGYAHSSANTVIGEVSDIVLAGDNEIEILYKTPIQFLDGGIGTITIQIDNDEKMDESDITNNIATQTFEIFTIEDVPDLTFGNINMTDQFGNVVEEGDEVINGTELSISVETLNVGGMKTGGTTLLSIFTADPRSGDFMRDIDFTSDDLITNITIPWMRNNTMVLNKTKWTVNTQGPIELHFFLDSTNLLKEYAEEDNNYTIHLTATPMPDFEVSLSASKTKITEDDEVTFTISVTDTSGGTFANYDQVYYKINTGTELITGQFDSSGSAEEPYTYNTPGTYEVFVDVNTGDIPIPESDLNDNRAYTEIEVDEKEEPPWGLIIGAIVIGAIIIIIVVVVLVWLFVLRKKEEGAAVCSECGSYLDLEATACPSCGAEFSDEVECGECGGLMAITDVVCPHCDATFGEVDESALPPPGEGPPAAPAPGAPTAPAAVPAPAAAAPPQTQTPAAPAPAGDAAAAPAAGGDDVAECYMCGAIIPLSAPMCPQCGAEFE
jgi:subtilase family serine protease